MPLFICCSSLPELKTHGINHISYQKSGLWIHTVLLACEHVGSGVWLVLCCGSCHALGKKKKRAQDPCTISNKRWNVLIRDEARWRKWMSLPTQATMSTPFTLWLRLQLLLLQRRVSLSTNVVLFTFLLKFHIWYFFAHPDSNWALSKNK